MKIEDGYKVIYLMEKIRVSAENGDKLMKAQGDDTTYQGGNPLSFLVKSEGGEEHRVELNDSVVSWQIWNMLAETLHKERIDLEKQLGRIGKYKPKSVGLLKPNCVERYKAAHDWSEKQGRSIEKCSPPLSEYEQIDMIRRTV